MSCPCSSNMLHLSCTILLLCLWFCRVGLSKGGKLLFLLVWVAFANSTKCSCLNQAEGLLSKLFSEQAVAWTLSLQAELLVKKERKRLKRHESTVLKWPHVHSTSGHSYCVRHSACGFTFGPHSESTFILSCGFVNNWLTQHELEFNQKVFRAALSPD